MTGPMAPVRDTVDSRVESALQRRLTAHTHTAEAYGTEFARLLRLTSERAVGGKLLRPRLFLDVTDAFGASLADDVREDAIVELATALELLHFGFLLHDDVIDGDTMRRGRPNLIGELHRAPFSEGSRAPRGTSPKQEHWASSSAILAGDLLLTSAVLDLARADIPPRQRHRLLNLMEAVVIETVAGEHTDVGLSDGILAPSLSDVLLMMTRKTAAYSFELPLRAAAVLADAPAEVEALLAVVGRRLGLAYQLQDDLLSTFGDAGRHGKDPHSDLREGKETAIIAYARTTETWPLIEPRFGSPHPEAGDALLIRDLLRECGAEQFARNLMEEQLHEARSALQEGGLASSLPSSVRHCLLRTAASIEGRSS